MDSHPLSESPPHFYYKVSEIQRSLPNIPRHSLSWFLYTLHLHQFPESDSCKCILRCLLFQYFPGLLRSLPTDKSACYISPQYNFFQKAYPENIYAPSRWRNSSDKKHYWWPLYLQPLMPLKFLYTHRLSNNPVFHRWQHPLPVPELTQYFLSTSSHKGFHP